MRPPTPPITLTPAEAERLELTIQNLVNLGRTHLEILREVGTAHADIADAQAHAAIIYQRITRYSSENLEHTIQRLSDRK